jgi:hypothetical protein
MNAAPFNFPDKDDLPDEDFDDDDGWDDDGEVMP